jgi:hypothetical protein
MCWQISGITGCGVLKRTTRWSGYGGHTTMRICRINAAEVLDSRGNPTVEAGVSSRRERVCYARAVARCNAQN